MFSHDPGSWGSVMQPAIPTEPYFGQPMFMQEQDPNDIFHPVEAPDATGILRRAEAYELSAPQSPGNGREKRQTGHIRDRGRGKREKRSSSGARREDSSGEIPRREDPFSTWMWSQSVPASSSMAPPYVDGAGAPQPLSELTEPVAADFEPVAEVRPSALIRIRLPYCSVDATIIGCVFCRTLLPTWFRGV